MGAVHQIVVDLIPVVGLLVLLAAGWLGSTAVRGRSSTRVGAPAHPVPRGAGRRLPGPRRGADDLAPDGRAAPRR